ncbi:hypothetical protein B0H13DRAFT_1850227 [Mycena leptocephala]|nr:hypothetical protein B0H13DRAFT_1850227 [Mycena leptocephala]
MQKRLKVSHNVIDTQSASLADRPAENKELRAEVSNLGDKVMELDAESSSLRAELDSLKSIRSQMSKKMRSLHETIRRMPGRIGTAFKKATSRATDDNAPYLNLKEKGFIPDETREIINDLVANDGVRPHRAVGVLKRLAGAPGISVQGYISDCSVRRVVVEGGVASQLEFMEAVATSKGASRMCCIYST